MLSDLSERLKPFCTAVEKLSKKMYVHPKYILSKYAVVTYAIAMNLTYVILYSAFSSDSEICIFFILGLTIDTIDIFILMWNRDSFKTKLKQSKYSLIWKILRAFQLIWIVLTGMMIISKVIFSATGITAPYSTGNPLNDNDDYVTALGVFAVGSLLCDCIVFIVLLNMLYIRASFKPARFILLVVSIFQFLLNIGVIQVTLVSLRKTPLVTGKPERFYQQESSLYFHTSAFVVCLSILGVYISCLDMKDYNKFLAVSKNFFFFFKIYNVLVFIFILACFACSLSTKGEKRLSEVVNKKVEPVLFGILIATCATVFVSAVFYLAPPKKVNKLKVEKVDLSLLTPAQKAEVSKLISYNQRYNSNISGDAALSLMEAYAQSTLDGMKCTVLRVYKSNVESKLPSYENYKAWDLLDRHNMIFDDDFEIVGSVETLVEEAKPLSKNQLKKLQKKKDKNKGAALFTSENICTEADYEKAKIFYEQLISTEALILLTIVENYDLTAAVKGPFGTVLNKLFGNNSFSKLLSVRFGLLGFHWPFRRATFYCSTTRKPVARAAAVMEAVEAWNADLPADEKCSMIIDPTYDSEESTRAIEASGWNPLGLPASHVIDLRPYRKKSLKFYLKQIKYRNTDVKFAESGGETFETFDFAPMYAQQVIDLWKNIAMKRKSGGNTSVLIDPDQKFIMSMGAVNNNKDRSLLFLKLGETVLASSVLYRLGETITSDLQGINYAIGKDYKIYFVMMQKVIEIALREGKSFVDFGPTTEKPKLDIGCQSIPLKGAITAPNYFLSICVKFAASNVDV